MGVARTENIIALCDVDLNNLARAAKVFPQAMLFADYRALFDRYHRTLCSSHCQHALPLCNA